MSPRSRWLVAFSVGLLAVQSLRAGEEQQDLARLLPRIERAAIATDKEAKRLRVLIAVDTDDQAGITWGRDGANVKALLETAFLKQNMTDRVTIDVFVGQQVTPEKILDYYRTLKVEPGDALLFYYSGHGGHTLGKGHFLALTHGKLYRKDVIAAMDTSKPKLRVLLTDCCANFAGGARAEEPKNPVVKEVVPNDSVSKPVALRQEPPSQERLLKVVDPRRLNKPPRPESFLTPGTFVKAKVQEPPALTASAKRGEPRNRPLARREEPALADKIPPRAKYGVLPTLATHQGKIPMSEVLDGSDGEILRDLFFRHDGLVDVNACTTGSFSFGEISWGGSLFTNSLIVLQKSKSADFDKNKNRVVEWTEFFPELQRTTNEVSVSRNRQKQVPEARQLGTPAP